MVKTSQTPFKRVLEALICIKDALKRSRRRLNSVRHSGRLETIENAQKPIKHVLEAYTTLL